MKVILALILCLWSVVAEARLTNADIIARAKPYFPELNRSIDTYWPNMPMRSAIAAQIEQETGAKWNPKVEFKTYREYGFGFGQTTIAYRKDGSVRFNNFIEAKKMSKGLEGWTWEDRYNPVYQLRAIVIINYRYKSMLKLNLPEVEQLPFVFSAYNKGVGGVLSSRRACMKTPGCNPNKWFGNVENTGTGMKTKLPGYGKSFAEINKEYVRNVLIVRRKKYVPYFIN